MPRCLADLTLHLQRRGEHGTSVSCLCQIPVGFFLTGRLRLYFFYIYNAITYTPAWGKLLHTWVVAEQFISSKKIYCTLKELFSFYICPSVRPSIGLCSSMCLPVCWADALHSLSTSVSQLVCLCFSVCLCGGGFVCLSRCLPVCLFLSVCLAACLPVSLLLSPLTICVFVVL